MQKLRSKLAKATSTRARRWVSRLVRIDPYPDKLVRVGNKVLDIRLVSPDAVVYSFGVGTNIDFDIDLSQQCGCDVHLFDPTPRSIEFMKQYENREGLKFRPVGIWTENGPMRFYRDRRNDPTGKNFSITNLFVTTDYFTAECRTLKHIMQENHHTALDVLKIDIEGAAMDVLRSVIDDGIHPTQILAEFEPPRVFLGDRVSALRSFYVQRAELVSSMRDVGYRMVRYDVRRYETLFVRVE